MFHRSARIRPTPMALSNLGGTLFFLGRYQESARSFEEAAKLDPNSVTAWANLGRALFEGPGTHEKAREPLQRAVELAEEQLKVNPQDLALVTDLADAQAMLGHGPQARALVARALVLAPDDSETLYICAGVDEMLGDREAALSKIRRALAGGYPRWEIERNPSLAALRADPRFAAVAEAAPGKAKSR